MHLMHLALTPETADFFDGERLIATLRLDDPFKPYLHPMVTPRGRAMTVAMPADHRHHKGLMYALRCEDLNFWEEFPGSPACGIQRVLGVEDRTDASGAALRLRLLWDSESHQLATYEEERFLAVHSTADARGYVWEFRSERTSLRTHRLIQSEWSHTKRDGTRVNYHGLGLRLPWAWCMGGVRTLEVDGLVCEDFIEASGVVPQTVRIHGAVDGRWEPPLASVTLEQPKRQACGLYANGTPFPYLALGPSNLSSLDVTRGEVFTESYTITLSDLD